MTRAESQAFVRAAASDLVTLGLGAFARWLAGDVDHAFVEADDDATRAAELLGVDFDADADEIRAALRARIVAGNLHPDHGGDGVEARELIAAQNLLLARANGRRAGGFDHA